MIGELVERPVGRPTIMTEETVTKLEEAFSFGCTDLEACIFADISKPTLYRYQDDNPDFITRKEQLKETTSLHARRNLVEAIKSGNVLDSKWYLERKRKVEFSPGADLNIGGQPDGAPVNLAVNWCDKPTEQA